jgi:predicted helicase
LFEYPCKYILISNGYSEVYLYKDRGIDIIYYDNKSDEYVGVQCKWRSNVNKCIKKRYVAEFLWEVDQNF